VARMQIKANIAGVVRQFSNGPRIGRRTVKKRQQVGTNTKPKKDETPWPRSLQILGKIMR